MGTEIQTNAYLVEYHSPTDVNGRKTNNGMRFFYHEDQMLENGQNPKSVASWILKDGYSECDIEKVKKTILNHESIFRSQVQELHRLYKRQQELMNRIKRKDLHRDDLLEQKSYSRSLFSPYAPEDATSTWNAPKFPSLPTMPFSMIKANSSFLEDKALPFFPLSQDTGNLRGGELLLSMNTNSCRRKYDHEVPGVVYSSSTAKQMQERLLGLPGAGSTSRNGNYPASCDRDDTKPSPSAKQHNASALRSNFCFNGIGNEAELNISQPEVGVPVDLIPARGDISAKLCSRYHLGLRDFLRGVDERISLGSLGLKNETIGRENLSTDCADICSGKSSTFLPSALRLPRSELVNSSVDVGTASRRKRIFGVEISEGSQDPLDGASCMSNTILENNLVISKTSPTSLWKKESSSVALDLSCSRMMDGLCADSQTNSSENPTGYLPWFLRNSKNDTEPSKGKNNSYFMHLDSLKNRSRDFFKKSEPADVSFLMQKKEGCRSNDANNGTVDKKILGFRISDEALEFVDSASPNDDGRKVNKNLDPQKRLSEYMSGLRHSIDLNLALNEDVPSAPSLPLSVVKIATSEIDLEAPAVTESEAEMSPVKSEVSSQECDRIAAEVMVAISSSYGEKNFVGEVSPETPKDAFDDRLEWFAEIISSLCDDVASVHVDGSTDARKLHDEEEESIPNGMDYFEFTTLKLQDTKEHYSYVAFMVKNNPTEEGVGDAALSKKSRRGRGRQRNDFQKDILPGLVTLSRHEVNEDLQAFQDLRKAKGCDSGPSERRGGRGRKRSRGLTTSPTVKVSFSESEKPICRNRGFEERRLSGWGKRRTRRLLRQRCANISIMHSFPIKC